MDETQILMLGLQVDFIEFKCSIESCKVGNLDKSRVIEQANKIREKYHKYLDEEQIKEFDNNMEECLSQLPNNDKEETLVKKLKK